MKLAKAGAGLPNLERVFIKNILVPTVRTFFTWDIALFMFKREVSIIKKLTQNLSKEELEKQVIIDRTFAIEDHSRQFSVSMVCEHLTIAGMAISSVIKKLSKEVDIKKDIKIEDVKPQNNSEEAIENFFKFTQIYEKMIKNLEKKQSNQTLKHPWFVKFNNFDWSVFMYMHTFIHRRQIEEIIRVLKEEK